MNVIAVVLAAIVANSCTFTANQWTLSVSNFILDILRNWRRMHSVGLSARFLLGTLQSVQRHNSLLRTSGGFLR